MIFTLLFLVAVLAVAAWWLAQQGLADKPWLETGPAGHVPDTGASSLPTAKIGLGIFLVVAGSLLTLLVSAYTMRMDMEDWRPLPWPRHRHRHAPALRWPAYEPSTDRCR